MPYLLIFYRLILRPLRKEPVRALLMALAVGLGVSVVLAIEMAGEAAAGSFESSLETLAGDADLEVTAPGGVPPKAVAALMTAPYDFQVRPRIEDYATVVDTRHTVAVIGVDVLSDSAARAPAVAVQRDNSAEAGALESLESVWVGPELGRKVGDRVALLLNDREQTFVVRGLLPHEAGDAVVMDLAAAARFVRRADALDRILVRTPRDDTRDWAPVVRGLLPSGLTVSRFGARTDENRRMLDAFRWNLRVLSYIALIVGAFLIYNTISVSVVRRRPEIGVLRALGATRSAVVSAFLCEAACFGLAGALIGLLLGQALARGSVGLVAGTVQSLYVSSKPGAIEMTLPVAALGLALGISIAVLSALAPALEAAQVAPTGAMARGGREHTARLRARRQLGLAAALGLAAWLASLQPAVNGIPVWGYVSAVCMIGAAAFAIPSLVTWFCGGAARLLGRVLGVEALLAARSLVGSLRRTSVLVGALTTAVAMTAAVGIMVGSFRETVLLWMDDRLQADLYIRPAGPVAPDRHPTLSPDTSSRLAKAEMVDSVEESRAYEISFRGKPVTIAGTNVRLDRMPGRRGFLSGAEPRVVFGKLRSELDTAIVSEPFSNKHGVRAGDTVDLTLGGTRAVFRVLDVYYDYSSERGYVVVDKRTLLKYLPDPSPSNVAVFLKAGASLEDGRRAVQQALAGQKVAVFSNRSLREQAIRIFDRTFAVTYALEAVAVVVAVMGIAGALLALVIDRRREFAVLRFLGGTRGQVRRMVLFEAGILGLLANAAGVALGFILSLLLIYVINKQSFGWTIQFHWPIGVLLGALTIVYVATLICALYPARVAANLEPIEVAHED